MATDSSRRIVGPMVSLAPPVQHQPAPAQRLREVPWYLWLVLLSAFAGWMFDAADISVLTLALAPSVSDLLGRSDPRLVAPVGGLIVAIKLVAWGIGGIAFGIVTDRIGRSRTMVVTVLIYSAFTGLSALAQSWQQLAAVQAVAGIGIGGEWAAGAALVAEATGVLVAATGSYPTAAAVMTLVYTVGLAGVWLGPETAGAALRDI